ncbi:nuclease-related domain-containing protein [Neobacillus mesonae]|uniref:nuclease-related domain-containing protein n=1 Tax=Neobacillus mesonae TaxID=1193713 RepID=UPI00204103BE|nr:nuclease-related domain-containing protein [Neobacillus mesonae]MCM3566931.1 NERD domain-containing protein [Neobacillus mesonae]
MIGKERGIPIVIFILEAILRRLPKNHVKYPIITEDLDRRWAGFRGEESLDYYLRSLPEKETIIFHDLNFLDGDFNCQIDTLLLTTKLALILEIKNMTGKLTFDTEHEQFFQNKDGNEKGYSDPIAQAQRHRKFIQKLLAEHHFPPVPVDYLVVISNSNAVLEFKGKNDKVIKRVCKSHSMLDRISLYEQKYKTDILTPKDLRKMTRFLVKSNTPPTKFLLQNYGIKKSELKPGVYCPTCDYLPLTRVKLKWHCPSCNTFSKDAHVYTILDSFLLYDLKITNQQFREFACVLSPDASGRMLRSAELNYSGTNKGRYYFMDSFQLEKLALKYRNLRRALRNSDKFR